jgi:hypothetical protein
MSQSNTCKKLSPSLFKHSFTYLHFLVVLGAELDCYGNCGEHLLPDVCLDFDGDENWSKTIDCFGELELAHFGKFTAIFDIDTNAGVPTFENIVITYLHEGSAVASV